MRPEKENFRLSDGVHKPDRKFAFSGRQRPILREHPVFCGTNHTVLAGHHTVDGMVLGGGPYRFRAAFS